MMQAGCVRLARAAREVRVARWVHVAWGCDVRVESGYWDAIAASLGRGVQWRELEPEY